MSNLAMEAMLAREAGMSYGKWKALQTKEVKEVVEKQLDPNMNICPECGKAFKKRASKQIYCDSYCQRRRCVRNNRERKKWKEN